MQTLLNDRKSLAALFHDAKLIQRVYFPRNIWYLYFTFSQKNTTLMLQKLRMVQIQGVKSERLNILGGLFVQG